MFWKSKTKQGFEWRVYSWERRTQEIRCPNTWFKKRGKVFDPQCKKGGIQVNSRSGPKKKEEG